MEEMFSSLIYFYLFFLYISFGTFFGQGIAPASQRGVKQCNQNMESDILRQHSLALSPWPSKIFKFHTHPDVTIRTGDKTNSYIILNKTDNNKKIENILNDRTKFKNSPKTPPTNLKKTH